MEPTHESALPEDEDGYDDQGVKLVPSVLPSDGGSTVPLPELQSEDQNDDHLAKTEQTNDDPDILASLAPPLFNNISASATAPEHDIGDEDEDDELEGLHDSFRRIPSPPPTTSHHDRGAFVSKVGEGGVSRMHKFALHETTTHFYIIGSDLLDSSYRILKIDRTSEPGELNIAEDDNVYTKKEIHQILHALDEGNRTSGGLRLKATFWGVLGFIRFTGPYYMLYVSKRKQVAMVGGHYIYQIDKTELMPLTTTAAYKARNEKQIEENRFISILSNLDLTRSFYFSYSYDVTRTLQHNVVRERHALQEGLPLPLKVDHNDMFVWNHYLLGPAKDTLRNPFDWCLAIVHGYVDQSALSIFWGRSVYVTIIARRSRLFAGARYLKRGANDLGYVANDVETEQIVSEMLTTSFHAPGPKLFANPSYTSHVQHRGSIPLHWAQDSSGVQPKPDIQLSVVDPFFSASALHFDNLFQRYGTPIYCLNLIKAKERTPRESKLLKEYTTAISYLNQFLPRDKQIIYRAWDMSRASKSRDQDVIGTLEDIAEDLLPQTGFFQNGNDQESGLRLQNGVARTNCVDCLDRTNAAQFVIAKKALGYQLQALGVIEDASLEYDSDAVNLFTHMWHDHGDTIAIQYGGSHLVNTMSTYRKINQWTSHSRDMVETFKRYYNNSFMDAQRQEAYNLFLGNYVYVQGEPMLWDLSTDYYLHHSSPRSMFGKRRPSYRHWYTDEYLENPAMPLSTWPHELDGQPLQYFDDYWDEYYRPRTLSSLKKLFCFKMRSNLQYAPHYTPNHDFSPFKIRVAHDELSVPTEKTSPHRRKGVKIVAPSDEASSIAETKPALDAHGNPEKPPKPSTLGPWLDAQHALHSQNRRKHGGGIIKETVDHGKTTVPTVMAAATPMTQSGFKEQRDTLAFTHLVSSSINPAVPEDDITEYHKYILHPSNIPLILNSDTDYSSAPHEFLEYLSKTSPEDRNLNYVDNEMGAVGLTLDERAEESEDIYREWIESARREEPLSVLVGEEEVKRYKAYRKWLRGKSLFKQKPVVGGEAL